MRTYVFIVLALFFSNCSSLKYNSNKYRVYKDIDKALKNKEKVLCLNLSNQNLDSIPITITQLKNIEVLIISSNKITTIPYYIGELTKLKVLRANNNVIKSISDEIRNCKELQELWLVGNELDSLPLIAMSSLTKLEKLVTYGNEINDNYIEELKTALPKCEIYNSNIQ